MMLRSLAAPSAASQHRMVSCSSSRRDVVFSFAPLAGLLSFDELLETRLPEIGSCPTCIGVVDGTLGR